MKVESQAPTGRINPTGFRAEPGLFPIMPNGLGRNPARVFDGMTTQVRFFVRNYQEASCMISLRCDPMIDACKCEIRVLVEAGLLSPGFFLLQARYGSGAHSGDRDLYALSG